MLCWAMRFENKGICPIKRFEDFSGKESNDTNPVALQSKNIVLRTMSEKNESYVNQNFFGTNLTQREISGIWCKTLVGY